MVSLRSPDELAAHLVANGLAPEVAAGCSRKIGSEWARGFGGNRAGIFDLASLTKPMTAVAIARASRHGAALDRTTLLGDACPALAKTASGAAPLELLLAHRAGLEAHIPVFLPLAAGGHFDAASALEAAANARRPECAGAYPVGGFPPVYSDLGYALAGAALAARTGAVDAGEAIARLVVAPLGLEDTLGTARELEARGVELSYLVAPTEVVAWRGGLLRGRVHDENAWALTGAGGSGHAGMFGTVTALLRFGEAVFDGLQGSAGSGPFAGDDLAWLVAERPGGTLRAGFDGKSAEGSSAGQRFGPRSFGHLGFTGTSLWIDPDANAVVVLLTNRVFPTRDRAKESIRTARADAHDALHAVATSLVPPANPKEPA